MVSPEVAEGIGIKETLSWIKDNNFQQVRVATDCLVVVRVVCSFVSMASSFGLVIDDC